MSIDTALIVAAGMGTRLRQHGPSKPLIRLHGKPLIEHAMHAAADAGVTRFVVVTGYLAGRLTGFLQPLAARNRWRLDIVHNPDFTLANGLSVLAAEAILPGPFYLAMCDHVVDSRIYRQLNAATLDYDAVALALDYRLDNPCADLDDVTRVSARAGRLRDIGKHLRSFNAFDTGIFRAGPALFNALRQCQIEQGDASISAAMRLLASSGQALGVDIGDAFWIDVDSPSMFTLAQRHLRPGGAAQQTIQYRPAIGQTA